MIENTFQKIQTLEQAMAHIRDDIVLMCGGFGGVGTSPLLTQALLQKNVRGLTLISNDAGFPWVGIGPVICNGQVKKMITTHIGSNPVAGRMMSEGTMEVEFVPQGTFAERLRAGGCGLGGVLVDTGLDTIVAEGQQTVLLEGRPYMIAPALTAEVGLVYAKKADAYGNLVFDKTACNINPFVAMASGYTIVHAEELVEEIDPGEVMLPGIFVDCIVTGQGGEWKWVWEAAK